MVWPWRATATGDLNRRRVDDERGDRCRAGRLIESEQLFALFVENLFHFCHCAGFKSDFIRAINLTDLKYRSIGCGLIAAFKERT